MDHLIFIIIILHIECLRVNRLELLSNHTHSHKLLFIIMIFLSFIRFSLVTPISFRNTAPESPGALPLELVELNPRSLI
ncbi:hypothetical protein HanXRQr2_Chr00c001g0831811 [Helianthus annuus]|uniref:Uncharacterized protein n=1 Tax=Helianthus annuus TaxID=4232 RepID=A0A9K3K069_HELAN|nr:hypothetical protein HanXRQr2_Chr00c001g0831811 [Helianthus annuus]KAJ0877486.1 hypothetical protein HanPSC8_Chr11g0500691 [Helianthus annuus]